MVLQAVSGDLQLLWLRPYTPSTYQTLAKAELWPPTKLKHSVHNSSLVVFLISIVTGPEYWKSKPIDVATILQAARAQLVGGAAATEFACSRASCCSRSLRNAG